MRSPTVKGTALLNYFVDTILFISASLHLIHYYYLFIYSLPPSLPPPSLSFFLFCTSLSRRKRRPSVCSTHLEVVMADVSKEDDYREIMDRAVDQFWGTNIGF